LGSSEIQKVWIVEGSRDHDQKTPIKRSCLFVIRTENLQIIQKIFDLVKFGTISASFQSMRFIEGDDPGLLIVFEGSDGSGKTTQCTLLETWLEANGEEVVVSKWNSSPLFKDIIKARKASRQLDPVLYSVLHAADFRHRYETVIEPSLRDAKIVLADRYVFTGFARDIARGVDRARVANLYSSVRRPDLVFYFSADPYTLATRIASSRQIKFHEAGQDVTALDDPFESYVQFAPKVMQEYANLHREFGFIILDAEQSIFAQHKFIRETYEEYLTCPSASAVV
jgi:dTMP kinase